MEHHLEPIYKLYLIEKDISISSKKTYEIILRQYVAYLKAKKIQFAETTDIMRYREHIKKKGVSVNWINTHFIVIKGFNRYLRANQKRLSLPEVYMYDVSEAIKCFKGKTIVAKNIITLEQAKHLILTTRDTRRFIWHYRDHAILYLMITTGLRSIEVRRALRKDYVDRQGQMVLYVQGKGRYEADEYVKVTTGVALAIKAYLDLRKDNNPYLFKSHSKPTEEGYLSSSFFLVMFKSVLKICDIKDSGLTPHALRHAAATFNLLRGGTLESTRALLRHSNINTTLIYAHHIERSMDDSEDQIEKFILNEDSAITRYGEQLIYLK